MIETVDIAIIGGGPAGLQAALVLARTRKKMVVFDSPTPPRNGASHGVHNVLGLDGLKPAEIRAQAWAQIERYQQVTLREESVRDLRFDETEEFVLSTEKGDQLKAKKVILALGFVDRFPEIEGFNEAWADTIINCPFCDGYENRDRCWGIVANAERDALHFPKMLRNWTTSIKLILNRPEIALDAGYERVLSERKIPVHRGTITAIEQNDGKVQAVQLDTGERIDVETLLWIPPRQKTRLEEKLIASFQLEVDDAGLIKTGIDQQTQVKGLYATGDVVQSSPSAIGAITAGNMAALSIVREWHG
jgi:thioredoxin reductase